MGFRSSRLGRAPLWLALGCLAAAPHVALAANSGTIAGRVLEKDGSTPVPYASVAVVKTARGAMSGDDGNFTIRDVPAGTYDLKVMHLEHAPMTLVVVVEAGRTTTVLIRYGAQKRPAKEFPVFDVHATPIDLGSSRVAYKVDPNALKYFPVDDIFDVIATKPGVIKIGEEIHIRGSRSDETKVLSDGTPITDPLNGGSASIAGPSIAGADVITGGITAEYGDVLGGVIDIQTKEGGDRFGGEAQWHTDRYGESVKTFDNYDRLALGFGGPTPVRGLTYYGTYEGTWSDTYLASSQGHARHAFFDFIRLGNRQDNEVNASFKVAYTRRGRKLTVEAVNNRAIRTPYLHPWSRDGFVSVTYDTSEAEGGAVVAPKYGRWSFFAEDSTFHPYNGADHTPTLESRFSQWKVVWTHSVDKDNVYSVRAARNVFHDHESVQGKEPWEYDTRAPFYWSGNEQDNQYYVTHGDFPRWADRRTTAYYAKADFTTQHWKGHLIKAGVEGRYDEFTNLVLLFPNQEARGLPGLSRSDFHNTNPEGSLFVQDRWEFEGMALNAGLRYDIFSPGAQIEDSDLRDPQTGKPGERYRQQISPRLGIAYPLSAHDVLSFHYGWLYQMPQRNYLYENRGSQATVVVRGNPNLQPQTNIEYQAAVGHQISRDVTAQFSVFFRDIFGLINTRQVRDELTNLLVPVWVNEDYASSRGFEASIAKGFSHGFSAEVNYTYQIASGLASDPNQGLQFANGTLLYLPISEQPLDWDQRHTLSATLVLRDPKKWGINMLWTYGSGLPYTPAFRNDRKPNPALGNSRRRPSQSTLSVVADKFYRLWGRDVRFFADARNILDAKNISQLSFNTFPNPYVNQVGDDYLIYYTETGRAGGAYLKDTNGDGKDDWVPLNDPRVWQPGRSVRVGVGVTF